MCQDMKTSGYVPERVEEQARVRDAWSDPAPGPINDAEDRTVDAWESWTESTSVCLDERDYRSNRTSKVSVPERDNSKSRIETCTERVSVQEKIEDVSADNWAVSTSRVLSLSEQENCQFVKLETCTSQASLPDKMDTASDKFKKLETDEWCDSTSHVSLLEVEGAVETFRADRWSDSTSHVSLPGHADEVASDTEPMAAVEPSSEMYYTASSEVSLLSDLEVPGNQMEDSVTESMRDKCVLVAGHVAAMRERFESMTRASTPCPELASSLSPSDALAKASPDFLG